MARRRRISRRRIGSFAKKSYRRARSHGGLGTVAGIAGVALERKYVAPMVANTVNGVVPGGFGMIANDAMVTGAGYMFRRKAAGKAVMIAGGTLLALDLVAMLPSIPGSA